MDLRGAMILNELSRRQKLLYAAENDDPIARFCPEIPTEKQRLLIDCDAFEVLWGGSAGCAKTSGLLMSSLRFAHKPGYAGMIFRRTYSDLALPGCIMDRAKSWMPKGTDGVHWDGTEKTFRFASGAVLAFGYLDSVGDEHRYKSSEFQFLGFDEATQIRKEAYMFLHTRVRRKATSNIPLRIQCCTNPGDISHDFFKARFIDEDTREDRLFIPALAADNPHIDFVSYHKSLEKLDPITKQQLMYGAWIRDSGGQMFLFDRQKNTWDKDPQVPEPDYYVLGVDLGASQKTASTAFSVLGFWKHYPSVVVTESYKIAGMTPSSIAEEIKSIRKNYKLVRMVVDAGALGAGYTEEFRQRHALPIDHAQKNNRLAYIKLMNGDLSNGVLQVSASKCDPLVQELETVQWNKAGDDVEPGSIDHCIDSMLYAWRECKQYIAKEEIKEPQPGTPEYNKMIREKDFARIREQQRKAEQRSVMW